MKVLIISLPRTGSTSLLYKLASEKGLTPLFEPFDGSDRVKYNNESDVVVKTIISHHSNNLELSKEFDEVILLSRKNLLECTESHAYQTYFSKVKNYNSNNPYYYEDVIDSVFKVCYDDIIKWNIELGELSKQINIPISYYEDIFDINSDGRLRKGNKSDYKNKLL
jgi:ABC-type multidrug transport system ATPase subunit